MPVVNTGSALRSLVLTPERIPRFIIPSRSPLLFLSPRLHRSSPDRTRLVSDQDDDSPGLSRAGGPRRSPLRLPPVRGRRPRRGGAAESAEADTDLSTRAAMSLPHVEKVTTPYGFRAVLAASPCTRRRESLFHQNKPVPVTNSDRQDPAASGPVPSRAQVCLRPVKALGLQVMKELKRPAAALKARSPATRKTRPC